MIIGIDIRTLMDKKYSGVSEYTLNLVREMIEIDRNNEYRLFYNSFSDLKHLPDLTAPNVQMVRKKYPNKLLNYLFFKIFNWPRLDLMLGVDVFLMPHINFIALSKKNKAILTVHDLSFLQYPEFFSMRKNIWHRLINVRRLLKKFAVVIAVSENTKNDLIRLCDVNKEKIHVVYSGLSSMYKNFVQSSNEDFRRVQVKYGLPEKYLLFLGNIEPRKNIRGLICAYNILRENHPEMSDLKLVIAGGLGWRQKFILRERDKSKYKEDIFFCGYVEKKDQQILYANCEIFVFPSFYEGFGFPPLEAQACGVPVIASFSSSLSEILGGSAILIDPDNHNDLALAIEKIISNQNLKNKLVIAGRENVKRFNWQDVAKQYLTIIKNL